MKRFLKYTLITLLALPLLAAAFLWGLYLTADMEPPAMTVDTAAYRVADHGGYTSCRGSFLRHNRYGLWELYTAGSPEESGAAAGALTAGLMRYQEQVFVDQIREFIPSDGYLKFLRGLIVIFNRNLGRHVPEEYRREIYARSLYCSHDFDAIGTPYERQLNYHAAHDIGHAMSQYMLVGCSSFAAWGGMSADGELVVGRNFDFYMGDDFARHKIVTFCRPQAGHPFVSIGWAGMIGVLSGMNDKGLTVTINAAKGPVPLSAATPISILAREILQHAATIGEALEIARRRDTFVSESLLVASARDGRAAIIEKTPRKTALYESGGEYLVCTNHYQSTELAGDEYNLENLARTDSPCRFARLEELTAANAPLTPQVAVAGRRLYLLRSGSRHARSRSGRRALRRGAGDSRRHGLPRARLSARGGIQAAGRRNPQSHAGRDRRRRRDARPFRTDQSAEFPHMETAGRILPLAGRRPPGGAMLRQGAAERNPAHRRAGSG